MAVYQLGDKSPQVHPTAWVAPNAQVMGEVEIHAQASVWYSSVLRGDADRIVVGEGSNIQDGSVLHADYGTPLVIGRNVTVGHMVQLHGCTVEDGSLIGIGAVVLNRARIGKNCLVGARALVTEDKSFPDGSLIMGTPAKVVRPLTEAEIEGLQKSAADYRDNALRHAQQLQPLA